jgi:hypothetical protein
MLEYISALGGDAGCRGGRRIVRGRPEEPEEGRAIVIGGLRVTRDGSRTLLVGGGHPGRFTIPTSCFELIYIVLLISERACSSSLRVHTCLDFIAAISSHISSYYGLHYQCLRTIEL